MFAERAAKRERRLERARAMVEDETPTAGQKDLISTQIRYRSAVTLPYYRLPTTSVTLQYKTVNRLTKINCVALHQAIRKQEKEGRSLCLIKS